MRPWIHTRKHDSGRESLYVCWKDKVQGKDGKSRWVLQRLLVRDGKEKTANRIADKIATEIAERGFFRPSRESYWTLGELARVYLERMKLERPTSERFRENRVTHILRVLGSETPIEQVTRERVLGYARTRLGENWRKRKPEAGEKVREFPTSPATVNRELSILRHMFRLAYEEWRDEVGLSEFRLGGIRPLPTRGREREAVFLSERQVTAILEAARAIAQERKTRNAREGELAIQLALTTGARIAEILAMRWEDLAGDRWMIRTKKGGEDRAFSIDPAILAAMKALVPRRNPANNPDRKLRGFAGPVFDLPPNTAPKDVFARYWSAVRLRAKVFCRFHDLRHTFASLAAPGRPLRQVQRDLGHRSIRMTERYAKFSREVPASESLSLKDLVPALVPAKRRKLPVATGRFHGERVKSKS